MGEHSDAEIAAYLDATTRVPDGGVDLIFVPGTRLVEPALIAANMLRAHVAPVAVLTGGVNERTGLGEAEEHCRVITKWGIPGDRLIVEDQSTNTLENARLSLPLVLSRCGKPLRVLAIAKWMHSRRVLMTLKRNWPPGIRYYAFTYVPDGVTQSNWFDGPSSADVLRNWEAIPTYMAAGHLAEITRHGGAYV